tara:strand:- start:334 stop:624 length:291 start_codon:yes stop_codon:yes gene_type:complete
MKLKYKVGDKVKSAPNTSDVIYMKAAWVGEIQSILCDTASIGAIVYDVLGYYEPIKDKDGYVDSYWDEFDSEKASKKPQLRQLRGDYLIKLVESTD